jgi:molecular chaperone DnaK
MDSPILGIDLGTCSSSAAIYVGGKVHVVLDGGEPQIPSVVYFPPTGDPIVGREAQRRGLWDPTATVSSAKRLMGRRHDDPDVKAFDAGSALKIVAGPDGSVMLKIREAEISPIQVAAAILTRLRKLAEQRFGGTLERAVMTVPVKSTKEYLAALQRAARIAGLWVVRWIAEPVAGILGSGNAVKDGRVLACDFGGGTFDVSLVGAKGGVLTPLGVGGDSFLGGDDFDEQLADAVSGALFRKERVDLRRDAVLWTQLRWRAESAKRSLSTAKEARIHLKEAFVKNRRPHDLDLLVDREWIEPRWEPLILRALGVVDDLLGTASVGAGAVERVVLLGGTMHVPCVRKAFGIHLGRELGNAAHPQLAVVGGAAYVGSTMLKGETEILGLQSTPLP